MQAGIVALVLGLGLLTAVAVWSRRRRRSPVWMLAAAVAMGAAVAVLVRRDAPPPLTPERLAAARDLWQERGPDTYDIELDVYADRLAKAHYAVRVRQGEVTSTVRDGTAVASAEEAFSVAGLFAMLERELELSGDPQAGFGAPPGYRAYLFARFDARSGRPTHYRRTVGGAAGGVEIRVERFTPR